MIRINVALKAARDAEYGVFQRGKFKKVFFDESGYPGSKKWEKWIKSISPKQAKQLGLVK